MSDHGVVEHLNPEELHQNPAFTNVVTVTGPAKTVYVGGQNAINASGEVVGKGDLAAQTEQIFHNLEAALAALIWSCFMLFEIHH
jgi:enamine deaminase RidA (YjgF/YER057c/UK114 family)